MEGFDPSAFLVNRSVQSNSTVTTVNVRCADEKAEDQSTTTGSEQRKERVRELNLHIQQMYLLLQKQTTD